MKQTRTVFDVPALSGFCMQTALLLKSAVPLYEGLLVMSEDAVTKEERELLSSMSEQLKLGESFSQAVKTAGCFPVYMEEMVLLGERTGTLDVTLDGLASYYDQEARMAENLRRALTYPSMMIFMLLIILFVLFTKIMPVFSGVYEQLGSAIPPAAQTAITMGGILSGICLAAVVILAVAVLLLRIAASAGRQPAFAASLLKKLKSHSKISRMTAIRRFCNTMSVTLRCGLRLEEGLDMAGRLADQTDVAQTIARCKEDVSGGMSLYDAVKKTGLLSGFDLQLLRVAGRSGRMEQVLAQLADDYDRKVNDTLDSITAKMEPIIVSVLAIAVGLVLLSVMVPLAGTLAAIG